MASSLTFTVFLLLLVLSPVRGKDETLQHLQKKKSRGSSGGVQIPALFAFGDSIVDTGNNNYITTSIKANYLPYGRDFIDGRPTGRFSNGFLITDIIAAALGIKRTVPPFLEPELETKELMTGVSFASAGSGFDNLTADSLSVIPLWKQLQFFRDYREGLVQRIGKQKTVKTIRKSIYIVFMGSNDFLGNYDSLPQRKQQFTVEEYQRFLLDILTGFIEDIYEAGARNIAIYGLPPPGCTPLLKTLAGKAHLHGCVDELGEVALQFNSKMESTIASVNSRNQFLNATFVDIYPVFRDIVQNPQKYGFKSSLKGCCGSGFTEVGKDCEGVKTCKDASKHVFWDALHSSQRTYQVTSRIVLGFKSSLKGCCGSGFTEVGKDCEGVKTCKDASKHVFWDALHFSQRTYQVTSRIVLDKYIFPLLNFRQSKLLPS